MKLVNSLALALFLSSVEAFGPAARVSGNAFGISSSVAPTTRGDMTMRIGKGDLARRQRFNDVLNTVRTNPSKETFEQELLSEQTGAMIEQSNWKVRRTMLRKVRAGAVEFEVEVPPAFGVPPTRAEREETEKAAGAVHKKEREEYYAGVPDQIAAAKATKAKKKAESRARSAAALAELKAKYGKPKVEKKVPEPVSVLKPVVAEKPAPEPKAVPEPKAKAAPAKPVPVPEPVVAAEPAPQSKPEVVPEPKAKAASAQPVPVPEPGVAAEPAPQSKPEVVPEPMAKAAPAKPAGGAVTPATIKALRDATGAGMMDCKKALLETDGDQEAAAEYLRKKGLAKADKKASRVAAEGKIAFSSSGNKAVMVEVNCETDFVGKDSSFLEYCDRVASAAIRVDDDSVETLMAQEVDGETLEATRQAMVAKIGENIQVRRLASRGGEGRTVGCYVHMNRIGVLVELEGGDEKLAADVAMHVAAMNPPYAKPDDVPADVLEKEKKILSEQALESGKPPAIVEKMVEGRIRKYLEEICLVSQNYVRDGDKTVGKLLEENGAKMVGFTRIVVGEGIEKKQDDFAAEVAKMAGKSEPVVA